MANEIRLTATLKDNASKGVERLNKGLGGIKGTAARAGSGLLTLGKITAGFAAIGITALVAGLVGAVRAAGEEEKGIARLNAALKANVKSFKGNTDSIEAVIRKREQLAFTDDALRASLARLVTQTGNVDKAFKLQAIAMDLARFKGIDLESASVTLVRAMGGNLRVLKELGIQLPKNATQTQILAAIQKKTAGQAAAYGKTSAGAFQAFQIAMGDLVEDIGARFLPAATSIARFLSAQVIPAISRVIDNVSRWANENKPLINQLLGFAGTVLGALGRAVGIAAGVIGNIIAKISKWATENRALINMVATFAGGVLRTLVAVLGSVVNVIGKVVGWLVRLFDKITANKQVMDVLRRTVQFVADVFGVVARAIGRAVNALVAFVRWVKEAIAWASKLNVIQDRGSKTGPNAPYHPQYNPVGYRAAGGPVMAGKSYVVGERGPEMFRPAQSGTIIPNHELGGSATINLTYAPTYSSASPSEAQQFARMILPALVREQRRQAV